MSERFAGFARCEVRGVPVLWRVDDRFKTMRVTLSARRPLDRTAAARSLLPALLLQGTTRDPDRPALARRMEAGYGAAVVPGTRKLGETHVLRLSLDAVAGRYLPGSPDQLGEGLRFLADYVASPRLDGEGFPAATFARERQHAVSAARALVDDRTAYASERAIAHACAGEPMAIPEYGGIPDLEALQREDPEVARADFLRRGQLWLVAMGALPRDRFLGEVEAFLADLPPREPATPAFPPDVPTRPPRQCVERVELQQSKLVQVLRLPWTDDPIVQVGRRLFVSMLGGGPHSRLFRRLREERSLVYYASAALERHKGLLSIQAGLDESAAAPAEAETLRQVGSLRSGDFTPDELDTARAGILSALQTVDDSVATRSEFTSEQWLFGADRTPAELAELYARAGRDEVVRGADGVWFDTSYLLAPTTAEEVL
jgi:predicted Zn-dependent peptidase